MASRDQLERNTISKNKSFQRKSGNKVDMLETSCDSWPTLCFAPLFTSIHFSVLLLDKSRPDHCTSPSNQKSLRGKKGMLSAERGDRDIWGHTKTDICSFAFDSK